jgi:hypothetical protein
MLSPVVTARNINTARNPSPTSSRRREDLPGVAESEARTPSSAAVTPKKPESQRKGTALVDIIGCFPGTTSFFLP